MSEDMKMAPARGWEAGATSRFGATNRQFDSIKHLLDIGWKVFPCHGINDANECTCIRGRSCTSPGKHPKLRQGHNDATANMEQVEKWAQLWPNSNWAVVPVGGVVVDIDPRNGGTLDAVSDLPTTPLVAQTGGGGWHLYFASPTEPVVKGDSATFEAMSIPNKPNWREGIDLKGFNGYVVLPGSKHASGASYAWERVDWGAPLPQFPRELLEPAPAASASHAELPMLDEVLNGVPEGKRDDVLFRTACKMRRQLGDGARRTIEFFILTAAANCNPPFPAEDARRKVEQAFKMDHSDADRPNWDPAQTDVADRLITGGSFVLDVPDATPSVWGFGSQVLWAEGEGFMIAGHQGLGKTTIAQQLILSRIGVREPVFLGLPVAVTDRPVLYLAMDRPSQAARSLRRMVSEQDRALMDERLMVWRGPLPFLATKRGALLQWVRETVPEVGTVVVDSLKDLVPGLTDDSVAAETNSAFQSLIADGIELLILHHERKGQQGGKRMSELDDIYGSTWLTSGLGSVMTLSGKPGSEEIVAKHVKQPAEEIGPLTLTHVKEEGRTTAKEVAPSLSVAGAFNLRGGGPLTIAELVNLTQMSDSKLRREVKKLVDSGVVRKVTGGRADGQQQPDTYWLNDTNTALVGI